MESPSSNAQSLLAECRRNAERLSPVPCMFFSGVATIIAVMLSRDFIDPAVAYSAWAVCSTALIGIGVLRSKQRNSPTVLGTIIALLAAMYIFFQVASAHPDQWIFLGWAFGIFSTMIWASLVHLGIAFSDRVDADANYGWPWKIAGMIYVIIVFCTPFGLILLLAARG